MVGEVLAGLSAFKSMLDLAKGLKDISDAAARNSVAIELQGKILAAYEEQAALVERVRELEAQVASFEDWEAQKQRYELKGLDGGGLAYALKEGVQPPEPAHYICPNCYADRKVSVLQHTRLDHGRAVVLACNKCGADIYTHGERLTAVRRPGQR